MKDETTSNSLSTSEQSISQPVTPVTIVASTVVNVPNPDAKVVTQQQITMQVRNSLDLSESNIINKTSTSKEQE